LKIECNNGDGAPDSSQTKLQSGFSEKNMPHGSPLASLSIQRLKNTNNETADTLGSSGPLFLFDKIDILPGIGDHFESHY
jgi:hypothetical protein